METVDDIARAAHRSLQKARLEGHENDLRRAALEYVRAVERRGSESEVYDEWDALQKAAEDLTRLRDQLAVEEVMES
jgi:hypothetical protein